MKLSEILENVSDGSSTSVSSFDYPDNNLFTMRREKMGSKLRDTYQGIDGTEDEAEYKSTDDLMDTASQIFLPSHTQISDETEVNLMKDGQVIHNDNWEDMMEYLRSHFSDLSGRYFITNPEDGQVLHRFRIST